MTGYFACAHDLVYRFVCVVCGDTQDITVSVYPGPYELVHNIFPSAWKLVERLPICPKHEIDHDVRIDGKKVVKWPASPFLLDQHVELAS